MESEDLVKAEEAVVKTSEEVNQELLQIADSNEAFKTERNDILKVDPRFIFVVPGHNVRDFSRPDVIEQLNELRESIRVRGVITPLKCSREKIGVDKNGNNVFKYFVGDGETRLRAVRELLEEGVIVARVPVLLAPANSNEADKVIDMITANKSHRFIPLELGKAYQKLINMGYNEEEIASAMGKKLTNGKPNVQHVKDCLDLLGLGHEIQKEMSKGKITANNVRQIDNSLKGEIKDKTERRKAVEEKLINALTEARLEGEETKIGKFLKVEEKSREEVISDNVEELLSILPNKKRYLRDEFVLFVKLLKAGHSLEDSIESVFTVDEEDAQTGS